VWDRKRFESQGNRTLKTAACGTRAQFWLNLQSLYELRLAEEKAGKSIKGLPRLKRREAVHV